MRILVVSNLYPPHHIGGYELGCRDVVGGLEARGHQVKVLTTDYGLERPKREGNVYRWLVWGQGKNLPLPPFPHNVAELLKKEWRNQRAFRSVAKAFRPQIIYLWNLRHLSTSLPLWAERWGVPVFYFVSDKEWTRIGSYEDDHWYEFLQRNFPNPKPAISVGVWLLERALKVSGIISSGTLRFPHIHFVSRFLKEDALKQQKPVSHGEVIPWGVDLDFFREKPPLPSSKRLLYVGQITPAKGVATAIEVVRQLVAQRGLEAASLTLVGGSVIPNFEQEMKDLVASLGLENNIRFTGPLGRERLPPVFAEHDILLFPSLLEEALAITILEAMACGLCVVATANGGNVEVLRHELNALIFENTDAEGATACVLRLMHDEKLSERLGRNGRQTVADNFELGKMVDRIESSLRAAIAAH